MEDRGVNEVGAPQPKSARGRRPLPAAVVPAAALILLWAAWSGYKIAIVRGLPTYNPKSDMGLFWSENATYYRHYRMIADPGTSWGEIAATLRRDTMMQYPEGIQVLREMPLGMELFHGVLRRWVMPSVPAHVFLLHSVPIFSGISLVMVFLMARRLMGSWGWSLFAAVVYATLKWSFVRAVRGTFLREEFGIPLLLATVVLLLPSREDDGRPRTVRGLIAGVLMGIAIAVCFISQYPLALLVVLFSFRAAMQPIQKQRLHFPDVVLVGMVAASLALPALRAKAFFLSSTAAALVHWLLWARLPWPRVRRAMLRWATWACTLVALVVGFRLMNPGAGSFSHVLEYVSARLSHPLGRPTNPQDITFAARIYWEAGFMGATLWDLVGGLRFALPLLPFALWPLLRRSRWTGVAALHSVFALALLVLGLCVCRLLVLAAPFVSVAAVTGFVGWSRAWAPLRAKRRAATVLTLIAVAIGLGNCLTLPRQARPLAHASPGVYGSLTRFLTRHTRKDEAFFARISVSAVVLLHATRPSLVHPFFESEAPKRKYERLLCAAFDEEEVFWKRLREYRGAYYIHDIGLGVTEGPGSVRYVAGRMGPMHPDWAATRCHFAPERLRYFDLVWQNEIFRVFRVRQGATKDTKARRAAIARVVDGRYNPLFDRRNFAQEDGGYVRTSETLERVKRSAAISGGAAQAFERGDTASCAKLLGEALRLCPNNFDAHFNRVVLAMSLKDARAALAAVRELRRVAPTNAQALKMSGLARVMAGDVAGGRADLDAYLQRDVPAKERAALQAYLAKLE